MKKSIITAALAVLSAGAFACGHGSSCSPAGTTSAGAVAGGANRISSSTSAFAASSGNGTSYSYAQNVTGSYAGVTATAGATAVKELKDADCVTTLTGQAGVTGYAGTYTSSIAYNNSTGSGFGGATAGGTALAAVGGVAGFSAKDKNGNGEVYGGAVGAAGSTSSNNIVAGTGQGAKAAASHESWFNASVDGTLTLTATGSQKGNCVTCNTPYKDFKVVTPTSVADSGKGVYNGVSSNTLEGYSNATVSNGAGGFAAAKADVAGWAKPSATSGQ